MKAERRIARGSRRRYDPFKYEKDERMVEGDGRKLSQDEHTQTNESEISEPYYENPELDHKSLINGMASKDVLGRLKRQSSLNLRPSSSSFFC